MANRITHTNNSSGHDGTYVYRSTSPMDPQALPAPIADEAPVAQGATFEYIDNAALADGTYYYRTQDHEGGQVSAVSDEVSIAIGFAAQVGDEVNGGIYAGTITYADSRKFRLFFAKQSGESSALLWGNYGTATGATDPDDGLANQQLILSSFDNGDSEAFYHCRDYVDGSGNNDYYLPAINEIKKAGALVAMGHPDFSTDLSSLRWSSTEYNNFQTTWYRFSDAATGNASRSSVTLAARPVRREPA